MQEEQPEERSEEQGEDAEGALTEDNPEPGEGPGEGDRGLGTQTGGAGGGESEPMRGSTHSGQGTAAHGGAPNEETRDDD